MVSSNAVCVEMNVCWTGTLCVNAPSVRSWTLLPYFRNVPVIAVIARDGILSSIRRCSRSCWMCGGGNFVETTM